MERLRDAIAKARAERERRGIPAGGAPSGLAPRANGSRQAAAAVAPEEDAGIWERLQMIVPDEEHLAEERIVAYRKSDPAYVAFDVLRTRLMRLLRDKGWSRVAITSPTKGCGKTTTATNLAMSLARQSGARTLLVDLDMKTPRVAHRLGFADKPIKLRDWLLSEGTLEEHLLRPSENLAVCLNTQSLRNSAELLTDPRTSRRLESMRTELRPAAVIYDLPPMLVSDDTLAFLPNVDCLLLVAAAGQTSAAQIDECERLLEGNTNFLGVLLNKSRTRSEGTYGYYEYGSEPV